MDFREVWMNTGIGGVNDDALHVAAAKACAENLKVAEKNFMYLLILCIVLLVLNIFCVIFFNRQLIIKFNRARFQPLPSSETASSIFRGVFDHDAFDMKG